MKIAGDNDTDLFPLAEGFFHEYQSDILWLEQRRLNMIFMAFAIGVVAVLIALVTLPTLFSLFQNPSHGSGDLMGQLLFLLIFTGGFAFSAYRFIDSFYRRLAKRKCLDILARCLKMEYRRTGFFHLVSIYDHHILPPYSRRVVEEGFAGKFKGFRVEFQDFFITPVQRILDGESFKSFPHVRRYYGLALKVKLNKAFKHHTVLLPAKEQKRFLSALPNANLFLHEDVNLVYHSFTKHYVCLSTHQVEARYVMDPAVMERFTKLAETFETDRISASFMDDEMVVVLRPLTNLFEVGTLRDPVTVLTIERTLQQINALRHVAEIFELNAFAGLGASVRDYTR